MYNFIGIYFIFFISMLCALATTAKLYLNGKNHLIAALAAAMALGELVVLFSVIWVDDFRHKVPRTFCIVQGIALQYAVYLQIVCAVCFSFHIYQILVNYKQGVSLTLQKVYTGCIVGVPIIMTIIISVVGIKTDAIKPLALNCDIKSPVWVRLIGYSGFNLALTFPGVYLSVRASYRVFSHLDQFKSKLTFNVNHSSNNVSAITVGTESDVGDAESTYTSYRQPVPQAPVNMESHTKSYNMTKSAAIRMVLFSGGFVLINVGAAFQTILDVIKGTQRDPDSLGGNDFAGGLMGLMIFIVFGIPNNVRRLFSRSRRE